MNPHAIAIVAAALDGHNPRHQRIDGKLTVDRDAGASDLELLVDELLFRTVPRTDIKAPRVHPQHAVAEVARGAVAVMWATAEALGVDPLTVDQAAVADRLRATVRAIREQEANDATD